jgi:hypothetical protein
MNYPIPLDPQGISALRQKNVNEELIATAIVGVVMIARSSGQSLDQLQAEVLADDALLDTQNRHWLSELVVETWKKLT